MAVQHDASSESGTWNSGVIQFTWTHTPVGTPAGVLVFVYIGADADYVASVIYGTEIMTEVVGGMANTNSGDEDGRVYTFFLGQNIPTGPQTVKVMRTNNPTLMYATCATVVASGGRTATTGIVLLNQHNTIAEQNVDDGSPSTNSLRYAGAYWGGATAPTTGANSTSLQFQAGPAFSARLVRETTGGVGSRPVGFTNLIADDRAVVHVAIKEFVQFGAAAPTFTFNGSGVGKVIKVTSATMTETVNRAVIGNKGTFGSSALVETVNRTVVGNATVFGSAARPITFGTIVNHSYRVNMVNQFGVAALAHSHQHAQVALGLSINRAVAGTQGHFGASTLPLTFTDSAFGQVVIGVLMSDTNLVLTDSLIIKV